MRTTAWPSGVHLQSFDKLVDVDVGGGHQLPAAGRIDGPSVGDDGNRRVGPAGFEWDASDLLTGHEAWRSRREQLSHGSDNTGVFEKFQLFFHLSADRYCKPLAASGGAAVAALTA